MSPAGGPVRGRYGDASGTCSRFWPCCSGLARPRRSQVRSARTAGRPHPSAVCGSSAVPASSPPARPGFGPRRRPPRCPRARVARGRRAEEWGGAAALCPACPALAIHSLAAGLRAAPATAGPRERAGVARALHAASPSEANLVTKLRPPRGEVGALGGRFCRPRATEGPGLWSRGQLLHSRGLWRCPRIHRPGHWPRPSQLLSGLRGLRLWAPGVTAPGAGRSPGKTVRFGVKPLGLQPVEAKTARVPQGQPLCVAGAAGLGPAVAAVSGCERSPLMPPSLREQCAEARCSAALAAFPACAANRAEGAVPGALSSLCHWLRGPVPDHAAARPLPDTPNSGPGGGGVAGAEGCPTAGQPPPQGPGFCRGWTRTLCAEVRQPSPPGSIENRRL